MMYQLYYISYLGLKSSYDIYSAGFTKQIKLVFKSDLSLFAKSNFFQISQTGKPQIQKLTNVPNTLKCNHK